MLNDASTRTSTMDLAIPRIPAPLEPGFRPSVLYDRAFEQRLSGSGVPLVVGLLRDGGGFARLQVPVFPDGHPRAQENNFYVERLIKFLLWQRGGYRLYLGGPPALCAELRQVFSPAGRRADDCRFLGERIYTHPFQAVVCDPDDVPAGCETGKELGRHLEGCRIGFDLGASDRKVSAVVDGRVVYSEEVVWAPGSRTDPEYHHAEILAALRAAAAHLPRLDAIGGSSAGIIVDNRPMLASLFRGVPGERDAEVKDLFLRLGREMGAPIEVINDGDVAALAGSMSLGANGVLGIALGSSQAAGYVDRNGHITGWLNELGFAPIDHDPQAARDGWLGDAGSGSQYLSQQAVFRLAPRAGIRIPDGLADAARLAYVQELLEQGHAGALHIWESMGVFLGYALAHYADFYTLDHVLILGRCTSGRGGTILLEQAHAVLQAEFPELEGRLRLHLPDEKSRRIGQAVAAASLPDLRGGRSVG